MNLRTSRLGIALTLVLATAGLGWADNVTPATARSIAMNSTTQDSLQSGVRASVWYKVEMFAGRSYQISVWSVKEDGVFVNIEPVELFSDAAGTVLVSAGVTSTDAVLEGSPNDANLGPKTTIFQPTATGLYLIHAGTDTLALSSTKVNIRVRETTLFSPWLSKAAGYEGFIELHNNTNAALSVTLKAYDSAGTLQGAGLTFTIPANATMFQTGALIGVPAGVATGVVLTHNGAFGAISGNITTLNGATGLSFDSPFTPRDSGGAGGSDSAATTGANSDITSLTGLTTPLSVDQGGTGQSTLATNGMVYGQGTAGVATTVGAAGQVLAGTAGAPLWTGSPSLSGNLTLASPSTASAGVIMKGANRFIHDSGPGGNVFIGDSAGNFSITGNNNVGVGRGTMGSATTGSSNTAVGDLSLNFNTTGSTNAAVGRLSLFSNTTGSFNTAIGSGALQSNTTGNSNSASGRNALFANTVGSANTATGSTALTANVSGIGNTANGQSALSSNTGGNSNTATGQLALVANTSGSFNTAVGNGALQSSTTASNNIAVGVSAGANLTFGGFNIDIGHPGVAAESNTIRIGTTGTQTAAFIAGISGVTVGGGGVSAVVVDSNGQLGTGPAQTPTSFSGSLAGEVTGTQGATVVSNAVATNTASAIVRRDGSGNFAAGSADLGGNLTLASASTLTTGNIMKGGNTFVHTFGVNNTFVGVTAGNQSLTGNSNTGIGLQALRSETSGSSNTATGVSALFANTTGQENTAHGTSGLGQNTTGSWNTASGSFALFSNLTGSQNTASGAEALFNNTTANRNVAVGTDALRTQSYNNGGNPWDTLNTAVGYQALLNNQPTTNTNGAQNTALGAFALSANTIGSNNTATGFDSLLSNTAGAGNTASGESALQNNTTGNSNTGTGALVMQNNTTGFQNTASGVQALVLNTSGMNNTASGAFALFSNTTGLGNTAIGAFADASSNNLTNATAIGFGATVNASNKIRLGNASVTVIEGQVAYTFPSDRTKKENFRDVDAQAVLRKLREMSVTSWNYIGHDPKEFRHYGPMAQDFYAAFGHDEVGAIGTDTAINSGDIMGILMIGLKGLDAQMQRDQGTIAAQAAEIASLKQQTDEIAALRQEVTSMGDLLNAVARQTRITLATDVAGAREHR